MLFLNPYMLLGLAGVLIPVLIHLFNRKSAQPIDWGAMRFLADSMQSRTRRILLEDALLMAVRCLLFGMIALALARPFVPPGSQIPWIIVLPALLISIALFAVAFAVGRAHKNARSWLLFASIGIFFLTGIAIFYESYLNLKRLSGAGKQDIAIIIDASSSMTAKPEGVELSNFDLAVNEARDIILKAGGESAFTIVLAGASPEVKNNAPLADREQLHRILENLTPSDGQMLAYDAILAAASALESGSNEAKQIIVLTDSQKIGWQPDNTQGWEHLADTVGQLPHKPQLLLRRLPFPAPFRNLAVTDIRFSRDVIGVDREVEIEVTLENTGTEAVTPKGVQLRIGGETLSETSIGQFPPGLKNTIRFRHHFRRSGAHVLTAIIDVADDLAQDNTLTRAQPIVGQLKVMIVDGNPAPRFFDRASAFIELALAPGLLGKQDYLIEPTIVPAPQIINIQNFDDYHAVILADVPRLPGATAQTLADYVERGGGLLIAPGQRAVPEFYNAWTTGSGRPLPPAKLDTFQQTGPDSIPPSLSLSTFKHAAVAKVGAPEHSDFSTTALISHWVLQPYTGDPTTNIAAQTSAGTPFVATRILGTGDVVITACSLDRKSGNITTRESFLPFVHELVYHIADPGGLELNIASGRNITVPLSLTDAGAPVKLDTYTVTGPLGKLREAEILSTQNGIIAQVGGGTMAGLYEIQIPETARESFPDLLTDAGTLPFTVTRPPTESQLQQLTRSNIHSIGRHIDVLQPESSDDALKILAGKSYGQELWKILAVGVLVLLVLEVALARWIATNRKTGTVDPVAFEPRQTT